jgi:hypothetical protein
LELELDGIKGDQKGGRIRPEASGIAVIDGNDAYGDPRVIKAQITMGHLELQGDAYQLKNKHILQQVWYVLIKPFFGNIFHCCYYRILWSNTFLMITCRKILLVRF